MREADLTPARVRDGALRDVELSGASLAGTDLSGCDLSSLDPGTATLAGAVILPEQALTIAEALGLDVRTRDQR